MPVPSADRVALKVEGLGFRKRPRAAFLRPTTVAICSYESDCDRSSGGSPPGPLLRHPQCRRTGYPRPISPRARTMRSSRLYNDVRLLSSHLDPYRGGTASQKKTKKRTQQNIRNAGGEGLVSSCGAMRRTPQQIGPGAWAGGGAKTATVAPCTKGRGEGGRS